MSWWAVAGALIAVALVEALAVWCFPRAVRSEFDRLVAKLDRSAARIDRISRDLPSV